MIRILNKIFTVSLFVIFTTMNIANAQLNASNYQTYKPDFILESIDDLENITKEHEKLGGNKRIEQKYLGKIIKTPFNAITYENDSKGGVGIGDDNRVNGRALPNYCLLEDEDNIEKLSKETEGRMSQVEVIGKVVGIGVKNSIGVGLYPCFFIKNIEKIYRIKTSN